MVQTKYAKLLAQILEMVDTACQACLPLMQQYDAGDDAGAAALLDDVRAAVQATGKALEPLLPRLEHAYAEAMLENIADTLDDIGRAAADGSRGRAAMLMEFQLFPFLRLLWESLYFWGNIFPDRQKMEQYYKEEFAAHYKNFYLQEGEPAACKLSIVIPGYNHLDVTKQCVEQLLRVTDFEKLDAELILMDHGSTDGTRDYFESLGIGKVVYLKKSIKAYMFPYIQQICQGEYLCYLSNDVLVTENWAEILLQCLASDPNIILAVPATPNISNLQMLEVPTNDPQEFIAWANGQNRSDPSRWCDRVRLMPTLGIYRAEAVNRLGLGDPYFYSMEFWDDDFSLRARRAGYRQILCKDAACYHFGSVTGKEGQQKEGTLENGRELFRKKHGVDAWGSGFCYDYPAIQLFARSLPHGGDIDLLALDCGFGDTPLQIRNILREQNRTCRVYYLTTQKDYLPDLAALPGEARLVPWLAEAVVSEFDGKKFSAIYLGRDIGCYEDFPALLAAAAARLVPEGVLVFPCANPFYAVNLHTLLQFSLPEGAAQCAFADVEKVRKEAEKHFSLVYTPAVEKQVNGINDFARRLFGKIRGTSKLIEKMSIETNYFVCEK